MSQREAHGTLGYRCVRRLANALMVQASTADLDPSCARQQSFAPFHTRWTDWDAIGS
jgi:hypothetical protein